MRLRWLCAIPLLALAACASEGDFGRKKPSAVNDTIMPAIGNVVAGTLREEPVSDFMYTDAEREFRDRAYRFLMPAHPNAVFRATLVEWSRTRILPRDAAVLPPDVYFNALMQDSWRSSRPPYRKLTLDMAADIELFAPLRLVSASVKRADRIRAEGATRINDLTDTEMANVRARIAENAALARWIDDAIARRIDAYHFALERLLIEIPEADAILAERMLKRLEEEAAGHRSGSAVARVAPTRHSSGKGWAPWPEDRVVPQK